MRYEISTVYVELDENGLPVTDANGGYNVIEAAEYANEAGYEQFFRVKDVLPDAAGGVGTDYVRNIENLYFSDGTNERLAIETNSWTDRHEKNDHSWRPPQVDGRYDVSGGTPITEYIGVYGDVRSKANESWDQSEWYVFQHTDSNGAAIDGQFILWHHNEDEGGNYNWGWADRVLTSDGADGYKQVFNTTTRGDIRGTVIDDIIAPEIASDDEIKAYAGDDTILAGDGRDRIKGGIGNDVIWGGDSNSFGWDFNGDTAYFEAIGRPI